MKPVPAESFWSVQYTTVSVQFTEGKASDVLAPNASLPPALLVRIQP